MQTRLLTQRHRGLALAPTVIWPSATDGQAAEMSGPRTRPERASRAGGGWIAIGAAFR